MKLILYFLGALVLMYFAYEVGFEAGRIKEIENIQKYGELTIKDFTFVEPPESESEQFKAGVLMEDFIPSGKSIEKINSDK